MVFRALGMVFVIVGVVSEPANIPLALVGIALLVICAV